MFTRTKRALLATAFVALGLQPLTGTANAAPVVGYVSITWAAPATAPVVALGGVLGTPAWSCSQTTWPTSGPFTVTCTPTSIVTTPWQCDVLHANSNTFSVAGKLRTTMKCDSVTAGQTNTVSGIGGNHYVWGVSGVTLSQAFTCTVDNGAVVPLMAVPNFTGFCGDPPSLLG